MVRHGQLLDRMRRFQETYEFVVCAVNQLPPRVMRAHGWIFSCLSSIPMNCSIRLARVSAFFAV